MKRRTRGALAMLAGVSVLLTGCVLLPPLPAAPAQGEPAPATPAPSAPAPAPIPTPTASAPTPDPAPSAGAASGPVLDSHGCSLAFIEEITFAYDALTYREGFLHPEVLEGFEVPCSGTQPSDLDPTFIAFTFAIVPTADGVLDELDARLLATGLDPDPIVSGFYQDAAADPVAILEPLQRYQEASETDFDDPESWIVLMWYQK